MNIYKFPDRGKAKRKKLNIDKALLVLQQAKNLSKTDPVAAGVFLYESGVLQQAERAAADIAFSAL